MDAMISITPSASFPLLVGLILCTLLANISLGQSVADCNKDAEELKKASDNFYMNVYKPIEELSRGGFSGTLDELITKRIQTFQTIESFRKHDLPKVKTLLNAFKEKYGEYGTDNNSFKRKFDEILEVEHQKELAKFNENEGAARRKYESERQRYSAGVSPYNTLLENIDKFEESVKDIGNSIRSSASINLMVVEYQSDPKTVTDMINSSRGALELAQQFNPENEQIEADLKSLKAIEEKKLAVIQKARSEARFPHHSPEFSGSNADETAKRAMAYLQANSTTGETFIKAKVAGPWTKRLDIYGNIIDYSIRVTVASHAPKEPENIIYVSQFNFYSCSKKPVADFCGKGVIVGWGFTMLRGNL